jgi:hypothetical protein
MYSHDFPRSYNWHLDLELRAPSSMAIPKGFLAGGGSSLSSNTGGSTKKKKKGRSKPTAADVFATPGVGSRVSSGGVDGLSANSCLSKEARARRSGPKAKDVLDYSRFDHIGTNEQASADREARLAQVPPALRARLGKDGEEMALQMAEKMRDNPELRPTPEQMQERLLQGATATAKAQPVADPASGGGGGTHDKITSTRTSFQSRMAEMETQKAKLDEQSARLERMSAGGDKGGEELVRFLIEQGLSEKDVEAMMTNPGEAGMATLKAAMDRAFGDDLGASEEMSAAASTDAEQVEDMSQQIERLAASEGAGKGEEEREGGVVELSTEGYTAATAGASGHSRLRQDRAAARRRRRPPGDDGAAQVRELSPEAAKLRAQMAEAQRQMEQLREEAAQQRRAQEQAVCELRRSQRELAEAQRAKERAGEELDATVERYKDSEDPAEASQAGELVAAKARVDGSGGGGGKGAVCTVPLAGSGGVGEGGRPLPRWEIVTRGSRVVGWSLRVTVHLPLVSACSVVGPPPPPLSPRCWASTYRNLSQLSSRRYFYLPAISHLHPRPPRRCVRARRWRRSRRWTSSSPAPRCTCAAPRRCDDDDDDDDAPCYHAQSSSS